MKGCTFLLIFVLSLMAYPPDAFLADLWWAILWR